MYFTKNDLLKIEQWLKAKSIKDSEFNQVSTLSNNDTVTIILEGSNKKISIKDLIDNVFKIGASDFVNVSETYKVYNVSLTDAIRAIPYRARKEGLVITFLGTKEQWKIYLFTGQLNLWSNLELWNDLFDFNKYIINSVLPDEEDLTITKPDSNGNVLMSFKDREYSETNTNGMGYVILRNNFVTMDNGETKNILTQEMFSSDNTIYEIRYDFSLNKQTITIPEHCILKYDGGSINDGKIIYQNTLIDGHERLSEVTVDGNFDYIGKPKLNEEDLSYNMNNELQLADRKYDSVNTDGMGYKILRKDKTVTGIRTTTVLTVTTAPKKAGIITIKIGANTHIIDCKDEQKKNNNGYLLFTATDGKEVYKKDTKYYYSNDNTEFKGTVSTLVPIKIMVYNTPELLANAIGNVVNSTKYLYSVNVNGNTVALENLKLGKTECSITYGTTEALIDKSNSKNEEVKIYQLKQEDVNKPNTIYEIRYDFDLNGEEITVPENCVLKFEGGSLNNGSIIPNEVYIESDLYTIFDNVKIIFKNSDSIIDKFSNEVLNTEWFGIYPKKDLDCTRVIVDNLKYCPNKLKFNIGTYYFSELHVTWNNFAIIGGTSNNAMDKQTVFSPLNANQEYVIKLGGKAHEYGKAPTSEYVLYPSIYNVRFLGDFNKKMNNHNSQIGYYDCGMLVIDAVQIGTFNVSFSQVYDVPCLFIGKSYELLFDFISAYNIHTKSDCSVIWFGSDISRPSSSITIRDIWTEVICGSVISGVKTFFTEELVINNMFLEGTMKWENFNDNGLGYTREADDNYFAFDTLTKIEEYGKCHRVPILDLCNGAVQINNIKFVKLSSIWRNEVDTDKEVKKARSLLRVRKNDFGLILNINNVIGGNTSIIGYDNDAKTIADYKIRKNDIRIANISVATYAKIYDAIYVEYYNENNFTPINFGRSTLIRYNTPCFGDGDVIDAEHNYDIMPTVYTDKNYNPPYTAICIRRSKNVLPVEDRICNDTILYLNKTDFFTNKFKIDHNLDMCMRIYNLKDKGSLPIYIDYYDKKTNTLINTVKKVLKLTGVVGWYKYYVKLDFIKDTYIKIRKLETEVIYVDYIKFIDSISGDKMPPTFQDELFIPAGTVFYNTKEETSYVYNGKDWTDFNGNNRTLLKEGNTSQRPAEAKDGFLYYDTSIKSYVTRRSKLSGTGWIDDKGNEV